MQIKSYKNFISENVESQESTSIGGPGKPALPFFQDLVKQFVGKQGGGIFRKLKDLDTNKLTPVLSFGSSKKASSQRTPEDNIGITINGDEPKIMINFTNEEQKKKIQEELKQFELNNIDEVGSSLTIDEVGSSLIVVEYPKNDGIIPVQVVQNLIKTFDIK